MSEENQSGKVSYGVKVEDAIVKVNLDAEIDVIDVLKEQAKKSSNTIDDRLVKLLELARDNADWEGYAKEHIL